LADKKDDQKAEELSKEEKHQQWIDDLKEDPYTREAIAILADIRKGGRQVQASRK
jgi:chromatin segregation and condensation protein Rec8/ScpA/Scc1 (kleisin family)